MVVELALVLPGEPGRGLLVVHVVGDGVYLLEEVGLLGLHRRRRRGLVPVELGGREGRWPRGVWQRRLAKGIW